MGVSKNIYVVSGFVALTLLAAASAQAAVVDYLIEAGGDGPGGSGVNSSQYSETTGTAAGQTWSPTSAHSTVANGTLVNGTAAPNLTPGINARFSLRAGVPPVGDSATFSFTPV